MSLAVPVAAVGFDVRFNGREWKEPRGVKPLRRSTEKHLGMNRVYGIENKF